MKPSYTLSDEALQQIAQDPKAFLSRNKKTQERIQIKQRRRNQLWEVSISITQAVKPVVVYTGPGDKIGDTAIEMATLESEIALEIQALVDIQRETSIAIETLLQNDSLKAILEAYYLSGMRWEEIACAMHYAYRWVLRLHKRALQQMQLEAKRLCNMTS